MGLDHEFVEVDSAFRRDRQMIERKVHQHRFAAPDAAPQVNTSGTIPAFREQTREEARASVVEPVERRHRRFLGGVRLQFTSGEELGIGPSDRTAHWLGAFPRLTRFSVPLKL